MSRNIKEIGKELMGKSLNSFHRKTGLTQLEENNKMQDGILNGILSQVDDAYIDKTEQSNVIHLDGSGDGVVVLDSIEGNTMVNIIKNANWNVSTDKTLAYMNVDWSLLKPNTVYTYFVLNLSEKINTDNAFLGKNFIKQSPYNISKPCLATTVSDLSVGGTPQPHLYVKSGQEFTQDDFKNLKLVMLEGDYTDKDINFFEGLQSSFEEKVNDEGKYEIEILSQSENIFNANSVNSNHIVQANGNLSSNSAWVLYDYEPIAPLQNIVISEKYVNGRYFQYKMCYYDKDKNFISAKDLTGYDGYKTDITPSNAKYFRLNHSISVNGNSVNREEIMVSYGTTYRKKYVPYKHNKIKLLLNEPLRGYDDIKDRLCVKDGKMMVEKKCKKYIVNGGVTSTGFAKDTTFGFEIKNPLDKMSVPSYVGTKPYILCDKLRVVDRNSWANWDSPCISTSCGDDRNLLSFRLNKINGEYTTTVANQWLQSNPITVIYKLEEPYYEEVLNEYGEPIILEGYENGTVYIDSTIVPTTTVRYTPKMESFKTLNEVSDNNTMLTNDVNDNIIPYMMDVDLMIMEKEMALMSHKNIRKMEVLDMTSMQKRTQEMLERLIKGKSLTEQECKTRVTTYLNAGKITDEQAEELMLLIDEVYA